MSIKEIIPGTVYKRTIAITDQLMSDFAALSGDYHCLHTDDHYAKNKGFAGRVAYGNILNIMVSALIGMNLKINDILLISQKINYKKPVYIGDIITLNGEITSVSEAVGAAEIALTFRNQHDILVSKGSCQVKCL